LLGQITHILETFIINLYVSTGLLGIVLAMAIESCCIPLPSEIVMPVAGIMLYQHKLLAGTNSWLGLLLVAAAGAIGCVFGSMLAYGIGYKGGRPLMLKYGRYVLISQHDADMADKFFQRWGSATAFFSRLLPVVRTYISLPAGISKMPFTRFCIYSFLGSFPFCLLLAYLGTILGDNLDKIGNVFHGLDVAVAIILVVLIILYIWRHVSNDRKARAAHAAPEAKETQISSQIWQQPVQQSQQWRQAPPRQGSPLPPSQTNLTRGQADQQIQPPPQWGQQQPSYPQQAQQWQSPQPQLPSQSPQPSQFRPLPRRGNSPFPPSAPPGQPEQVQWGQMQPPSWPAQGDEPLR
jgi:membrane protein DedA with SNARE-associated domain